MATQKKIELVEEYTEKFKNAQSIFLADFTGINVAQITELRRAFREADVQYRVVKNTLAKRSLDAAGIEGLDEHLKGVTSFAYSDKDAVAPIKVINEFNKKLKKENIALTVKGCVFEGRIFDAEQADQLASLPSREVLLSQLVGLLQSPLSKFVGVLSATGQKLVGVLQAVKNQKS